MGRLADEAVALAERLRSLPVRIQALMIDLNQYVEPHLTDRKSRREAIQIEAMAIVRESWALSAEVQRLAETARIAQARGRGAKFLGAPKGQEAMSTVPTVGGV